jgi:tRNA(Ile)-lysidine synthase
MAADLRRTGLIRPGERVLVGVSGGPDSVALLSLLATLAPAWKLQHRVVHVNHGLRGAESEDDARFVATLCRSLGVECVCERVDLMALRARLKGRSLQEIARIARYDVFRREARHWQADKVALGHTADDQAETVLMWMLRGAGGTGLAGIPPSRDALFVRPLLGISRAEILEYIQTEGLAYRTDSSNAKRDYLRNRIRHELLPELKRLNPAIVRVLARGAQILREEQAYLDGAAQEHLARAAQARSDGSVVLDRDGVLALPVGLQRRVIRAWLRRVSGVDQGPSFGTVDAVLGQVVRGRSGGSLSVPGGRVWREYGRLVFVPAAAQSLTNRTVARGAPSVVLPIVAGSRVRWPLTGQTIRLSVVDQGPGKTAARPERPATTVTFLDADRFTQDLVVRTWQPGDAFQPAGMGGRHKKVQDFFSDLKVPREVRRRLPLLVAPEGILWIAGYRADHRFCATAGSRRVLKAELTDAGSDRGD